MRVANSPTSTPRSMRVLSGALAMLLAVSPVAAQTTAGSAAQPGSSAPTSHKKTTKSSAASSKSKAANSNSKTASRKSKTSASRSARAARAARIKQAFVASAELRPMAQQLATLRTPAAYAGVTKYAHQHTGEAASAAYLALGHADLADRRFADAADNLRLARQAGQELADYADFLGAQANHEAGNEQTAETQLRGFATRYPDSIFNPQVPELEANVLLTLNNAA